MENQENSFKARVCKAINDNASLFESALLDYEYLVCSKAFDEGYHIVKAHKGNYLHLTGVHTNIKPSVFYDKAHDGKIAESDFDFRKVGVSEKSVKGSVREKIIALPSIQNFFSNELMAENKFERNKVFCSFAAANEQSLTLGFVKNGNPRSLMKGNKLHADKSEKVDCVLRRKTGSTDSEFTEMIQGDAETLSEYIEKIGMFVSDELKSLCIHKAISETEE